MNRLDWIHLAQDMARFCEHKDKARNSKIDKNFFTCFGSISFSRTTVVYGMRHLVVARLQVDASSVSVRDASYKHTRCSRCEQFRRSDCVNLWHNALWRSYLKNFGSFKVYAALMREKW
jgi:hypothetical protein